MRAIPIKRAASQRNRARVCPTTHTADQRHARGFNGRPTYEMAAIRHRLLGANCPLSQNNCRPDRTKNLGAMMGGSELARADWAIHEEKPVVRGERLACYFFMQSPVKDNEARRQLFDMDMALIALRQKLGDGDPHLVRLTALYNNLLRKWTDC